MYKTGLILRNNYLQEALLHEAGHAWNVRTGGEISNSGQFPLGRETEPLKDLGGWFFC